MVKQFVLVTYDIPKNKRRLKIMKTLEGFGSRVQYSVFECQLKPAQLIEMRKKLYHLAKEEDSVRLYYLSSDDVKRIEIFGNGEVTAEDLFYLH